MITIAGVCMYVITTRRKKTCRSCFKLCLAVCKSQISDINGHLINCFLELKKDPEKLFKDVNKLIDAHTENIYYKRRDEFNISHSP